MLIMQPEKALPQEISFNRKENADYADAPEC
jgi:hypothetical protein